MFKPLLPTANSSVDERYFDPVNAEQLSASIKLCLHGSKALPKKWVLISLLIRKDPQIDEK